MVVVVVVVRVVGMVVVGMVMRVVGMVVVGRCGRVIASNVFQFVVGEQPRLHGRARVRGGGGGRRR